MQTASSVAILTENQSNKKKALLMIATAQFRLEKPLEAENTLMKITDDAARADAFLALVR